MKKIAALTNGDYTTEIYVTPSGNYKVVNLSYDDLLAEAEYPTLAHAMLEMMKNWAAEFQGDSFNDGNGDQIWETIEVA